MGKQAGRDEPTAVAPSHEDHRQQTSKRTSIVDHILTGEPWPDEMVEAINDRRHGRGRDFEF